MKSPGAAASQVMQDAKSNKPKVQTKVAISAAPARRWFDAEGYRSGTLKFPTEKDLSPQGAIIGQILSKRKPDGATDLPPFPESIIKLIDLLKNPATDNATIAKCLKTDPVVAAEVLRFANSALYAPTERVVDLRHAVSFLGFRRLHSLALGIATKVTSGAIVGSGLHQKLWIHSVSTGALAALMAREIGADHESAFLCGLLHDVGKIAVAAEIGRLRKKIIVTLSETDMTALLEVHHSAMGRALARYWRLPEIVDYAILYHHGGAVPESALRVCAVVQACDSICYALGLGSPVTPFAVLDIPEWGTLKLSRGQVEALLEGIVPSLYAELTQLG